MTIASSTPGTNEASTPFYPCYDNRTQRFTVIPALSLRPWDRVGIGVGVNVQGGETLSDLVGQPVTDLRRHLGPVNRTEMFLQLVAGLDDGLALFEARGFAAFQDDWQACHVHQDREVLVHAGPGEPVRGHARGVDDQGALLLETESGLRRFHSGEVSVRAVAS